jgi:hypothetical protein
MSFKLNHPTRICVTIGHSADLQYVTTKRIKKATSLRSGFWFKK